MIYVRLRHFLRMFCDEMLGSECVTEILRDCASIASSTTNESDASRASMAQ